MAYICLKDCGIHSEETRQDTHLAFAIITRFFQLNPLKTITKQYKVSTYIHDQSYGESRAKRKGKFNVYGKFGTYDVIQLDQNRSLCWLQYAEVCI